MQKPKSPGPEKRVRSDSEIQEVAERIGQGWTPGDLVLPWIRQHEPELTALVSKGWSWEDVGKAMARAKITYKTGATISGTILRKKIYMVRKEGKHKPEPAPVPLPQVSRVQSESYPQSVQTQEPRTAEPEFRPVRFRQPYTPPPPSQPALPPRPKPPKRTPEEVRAMLSGSAPEGS